MGVGEEWKERGAVQMTLPTRAFAQHCKRDADHEGHHKTQKDAGAETENTYVEGAVQDGAGVLVLEPHGVGRHIVEAHGRVPGGDQQELRCVGAELHRGDAVLGGLVQFELVRTGHLGNKGLVRVSPRRRGREARLAERAGQYGAGVGPQGARVARLDSQKGCGVGGVGVSLEGRDRGKSRRRALCACAGPPRPRRSGLIDPPPRRPS